MSENIVNFTEEGNKLVELFKELEEVIRKKCGSAGIKEVINYLKDNSIYYDEIKFI